MVKQSPEEHPEKEIDFAEFLEEQHGVMRTEAFYCTKSNQVKGVLTLKEHIMTFDPDLRCFENEEIVKILPNCSLTSTSTNALLITMTFAKPTF